MLPEIHFGPSSPAAIIASPPPDTETRTYIAKPLPKLPVQDRHFLVPYESFQPPLYYLTAGVVAQVAPAAPAAVLYIGRLVAVLFGAATVYFCWLATRELAPEAPVWDRSRRRSCRAPPPILLQHRASQQRQRAVQLTSAAAFYVWIRGLRYPEFDQQLFGARAMLGLALLSKLTAVALLPRLALVILFRMLQLRPSAESLSNWLKRSLSMIVGATLSAVLICGW
jgi:hypothetical protein